MLIIKEIIQKIQLISRKYFLLIDFIFLLFIIIYVLAGISFTPFHGDESTYINISQDYDIMFKKRDFGRVLFNPEGNSKQYLRLTTGSILAYSIGFVRDITNNDDPIKKWLWGSSWDANIKMNNMPAPQLLNISRTCSALMGALGIVLFFFTSLQLSSSRLVAWIATLLLTTHGDVLLNIRRAMQEGPKFLFIILTIYIATFIIKNFHRINTIRYLYAFLGIASGFSLAAKQDIAPMLVAIYLALALIPLWKKEAQQNIFINIFYLGLATILAFAFFLILMPVFWEWWENALALIGFVVIMFQIPVWKVDKLSKPLAFVGLIVVIGLTIKEPNQWNTLFTPLDSMIKTREGAVSGQLVFIGADAENIDKLPFFLETIFTSRVMYAEVDSFDVPPFHEQIAVYEDSFLSGRMGPSFMDGIVFILAIFGGWYMLKPLKEESLFVFALFIVTGIFLYILIPLPWQRYFLVMQIPYSIMIGMGFKKILTFAENKKPAPCSEAG